MPDPRLDASPPVVSVGPEFNLRAAEEPDPPPAGSATETMSSDRAAMRRRARGFRGSADNHTLAFRRYGRAYVRAEEAAREARRGMCAGSFVAPWDWRMANR